MKVLVHAEYNKKTDNPVYWFLDTISQEMEKLVIPRGDAESCFKQKGLKEKSIYHAVKTNGGDGTITGIDWITQYDLLQKKEIEVARVRMKNARAVGKYSLKTSNENNIKRIYRHAFDCKWYFGMPYNNHFKAIEIPIDDKYQEMFQLDRYDTGFRDQLLQWTFAPLPKMRRMAIDIEVQIRGKIMPDVREALEPIISASVVYSDDRPGVVFMIKSRVRNIEEWKNKSKRNQMLAEQIKQGNLEVKMMNSEADLLEHVFQRMAEPGYPLIVTFFGSGFDLPYLYNRARLLKFFDSKIPFNAWLSVRRDKNKTFREWRINFRKKLHLDVHTFLDLPVIKNYVFKNKYLQSSLAKVSPALIKLEKYEYDGDLSDLPLSELAWYNYWDSYLTMELTKLDNEIMLKIIFMFMRLGRQTFHDAAHRAISSKIINLLYGYMIEKNILIPSTEELKVFGQIESESTSGKTFKGATILDVLPGMHLDEDTLDFSSLYPSVMCNSNVSFETMNCGHKTCKEATDNRIPELSHYTCKIYRGIMPKLIETVRDIRLGIFKPIAKEDPEASAIEQGLKVFINASFGVTGYEHFGLFCPPAGESTAALGREALMKLKVKAETYPGVTVIFGDTDSVGLSGATQDTLKELEEWSLQTLDIELTHEYHAKIFVMATKKNYFHIDEDNKITIKGLMGKKRNVPPIVVKCFNDCLDQVKQLCIEDNLSEDLVKQVFIDTIKEYYLMIWNREGDVRDYAFTTQMTKIISDYKKTTPRHVKAAKALAKWMKEKSGVAYKHMSEDRIVPAGSYISYVNRATTDKRHVMLESVTKPKIPSEAVPVEVAVNEDICPELVHAALISAMSQLLDPIGIPEGEVIVPDPNSAQTTLEMFA